MVQQISVVLLLEAMSMDKASNRNTTRASMLVLGRVFLIMVVVLIWLKRQERT